MGTSGQLYPVATVKIKIGYEDVQWQRMESSGRLCDEGAGHMTAGCVWVS